MKKAKLIKRLYKKIVRLEHQIKMYKIFGKSLISDDSSGNPINRSW